MRINTPGGSPHTIARRKPEWALSKAAMMVGGLSCFLTSTVGTVSANEWTLEPKVGLSEQFTDNAFGTSSNATSDFITSVDVGFDITGETLRSDLSVSYTLTQDYYAHNHELDGYTQRFLGIGNIEILSDQFFIDSRVTFTEETLSRTGNTSATDRTQSSDRTQVFNGEISPYFVHNFGGYVIGVARYSYSETAFFEPNVGATTSEPSNQQTNEYQLDLSSGRRFSNFRWSFENGLVSSESEDGDSFVHLSSLVNGQVPINRLFSLIGTVGYDDFDADDVDDDAVSGAFGGAGVRFHPNSRTDASFQIGHRFGDPIFDFNASYAPTSADTVTASYHVSIATADQSLVNTELLDTQGELVRPNFTVTDYVDDITKSKVFTLRWDRRRGRNNYGLTGDLIEREFLSDDTNDLVVSVSANYGRQLSQRADLSLRMSYSEVVEGQTATDEDETYTFGTSYNYQFGNGMTGSIGYDFLNRDSKTGDDLRENAVTLSIRKTF